MLKLKPCSSQVDQHILLFNFNLCLRHIRYSLATVCNSFWFLVTSSYCFLGRRSCRASCSFQVRAPAASPSVCSFLPQWNTRRKTVDCALASIWPPWNELVTSPGRTQCQLGCFPPIQRMSGLLCRLLVSLPRLISSLRPSALSVRHSMMRIIT